MPDDWHTARVVSIFKKGDPAECANYRPISLLWIGYKMFAIILLECLKKTGAEARIWPTQFGFCSGRGSANALFLARRMLENVWAAKDGQMIMLALHWAKAFDSISPEALLAALRRFGLPGQILEMIGAIYSDRAIFS